MRETLTGAQRIRQRFMERRPLKHPRVLSPFQGVLATGIMADEVRAAMGEEKLDPAVYRLSVALVVAYRVGTATAVSTIAIKPDPDAIRIALLEMSQMKDPKPVGAIFRIVDADATPPIGRDWMRHFLVGAKYTKYLADALQAQATPGAGMQ
jgi:hypothetical protein